MCWSLGFFSVPLNALLNQSCVSLGVRLEFTFFKASFPSPQTLWDLRTIPTLPAAGAAVQGQLCAPDGGW